MKESRSNFKVVVIALSVAAVICLTLSALVKEDTLAGIFKILGWVLLGVAFIQLIVFKLNPALFNNKKQLK